MSEYEPRYAEGQILVWYKGDAHKQFVKGFGQRLGYELSEQEFPYAWSYDCTPGQEAEAIAEFLSYDKFVESAMRRDLKLEDRWKALEEVIARARNIEAETPDREFQASLDGVIRAAGAAKKL